MLVQIIFSLVCAAIFAKVTKALIGHLRLRHAVRDIPGSNGLPILGTRIKSDSVEFFQQLTSLCLDNYQSGIVKLWTGPVPLFLVFRPRTAEVFYKSPQLSEKSFLMNMVKSWLGDGLPMSSGEKWMHRRRMLTPAFHFKILEKYLDVFNDAFSILVRILSDKASETSEFDIQPYIYRCMLDNICETAMGVKIDAQEQANSELIRTTYRESDLVRCRLARPWLWPDFLFRLSSLGREEKKNLEILHGFSRKVIADRKAERQNKMAAKENSANQDTIGNNVNEDAYLSNSKPRYAFLDLLLETAEKEGSLTDEGIQEEVDTFMFAGHDTTAASAVWLTYMLAFYPDEQAKVQEEIDAIFGDGDKKVTNEDIQKLRYTDCFIKETLRLYPSAPFFTRAAAEPCVIGGYSIPKGCTVAMLTNVLHRDPESFPDPEKFDPTRWLDESSTSRHPFSYTPFSAGSRNCMGQRFAMLEEKVFMCHLMRNFNVTTKTKREEIAVSLTIVTKPSKPALLQLTKRK